MIKREGGKWVLEFSGGRREFFHSKREAKNREGQVKYFKSLDKKK